MDSKAIAELTNEFLANGGEINATKNKSPTSSGPRRVMRLPEVMMRTGFNRGWIYQLMADGKFPKAHKIGLRAVGWDSFEIDEFVDSLFDSN